jgi:hypothetical protein
MGDWIDSIIARSDEAQRLHEEKLAEHNAAIKTALVELEYLEKVLANSGSQAQLLIAQHTFMNVQARIMRLQLEAMLRE